MQFIAKQTAAYYVAIRLTYFFSYKYYDMDMCNLQLLGMVKRFFFGIFSLLHNVNTGV